MKPIAELTESELRDELAEWLGWKPPGYEWPNPESRSSGCWTRRDESVPGEIVYESAFVHPIPPNTIARLRACVAAHRAERREG